MVLLESCMFIKTGVLIMSNKTSMAILCAGIALAVLAPDCAFAGTESFDIKGIESHTQKIINLVYGNMTYIAGGIGGGYGIWQCIAHSSINPLFTFAGIGLAVGFLPSFLDFFKVSSMLLG